MNMLIKVPYNNNLFEIAKQCRVAPCTIIMANNNKNENELDEEKEIFVPINIANLCEIKDSPDVVLEM